MCGVAGWIDLAERAPAKSVLTQMTNAISHRGPDGHGSFYGTTRSGRFAVALGHRRLAIIDPEGGAQPMLSTDGKIALVYNGEIYNFQALRRELIALGFDFETRSDTEVLLNAWRAWGVDCLPRLRGMFAFALWDGEQDVLFLARDRFGKKPLLIHQQGSRLVFGSAIDSILASGIDAVEDPQSIYDYLLYRYVPAPNTLFTGIKKLMPGSYLLWKKGEVQQRAYYSPPDGDPELPQKNAHIGDPVKAFTEKLNESVGLRMISDVPFGLFLSGGVDSAAVLALACTHSNLPIRTFSIGFDEPELDERSYARLAAERFKSNHTEWRMRSSDIVELLPKAIKYRNGPLGEPSDVAIMALSEVARQTVKMVLTGEGSDELLAGYPKHKAEVWGPYYRAIMPPFLHRGVIEPLIDALPERFRRVRTAAHAIDMADVHERYPRWFGSLNFRERDALALLSVPARPVSEFAFAQQTSSPLRQCLYFDQRSWLPDNLLERGDTMTMAAGIEARMPFLDHELVALVASMPDSVRIRNGEQKWILREAMRHILPTEILTRPKIGLRIPVAGWFRDSLRGFVFDKLLSTSSLTRRYLQPKVVETILTEHANGRVNHEKLIWQLLNLELFMEAYKPTRSTVFSDIDVDKVAMLDS